jgi:hypothetical protein
MSILWTLLSAFVRFWAWTAHRSATKWGDLHTKFTREFEDTCRKDTKGTEAHAKKQRSLMRLMDAQERAGHKWERKRVVAAHLEGIHNWLSRPRTIVGWIAGATALPATAGAAWLSGIDVPAWVIWAGTQLQRFTAM